MSNTRPDQLQHALVEEIKRKEGIRSSKVEAAFRSVPRHLFLPDVPLEEVYSDQAIVIKKDAENIAISSSSQPVLMANMLEALALFPGAHVLEIGTGTGYNAALLSHIVGSTGHVVSIDIDADLVTKARHHLIQAGYPKVEVLHSDGGEGAPAQAPFDAILVTVGCWDIPPTWMDQLKPGGRLVVPLWFHGSQLCITFRKESERLHSLEMSACGFVRLRGAFAGPETVLSLDKAGQLQLTLDTAVSVDAETVRELLRSPHSLRATGLRATATQIAYGLYFWLGIHNPSFVHIHAFDEMAKHEAIPLLFGQQGHYLASAGLVTQNCLALLTRVAENTEAARPFQLGIVQYGNHRAAEQLLSSLTAWHAAGRPSLEEFRVTAYPINAPQPPIPTGVVHKRWMSYYFTRR